MTPDEWDRMHRGSYRDLEHIQAEVAHIKTLEWGEIVIVICQGCQRYFMARPGSSSHVNKKCGIFDECK